MRLSRSHADEWALGRASYVLAGVDEQGGFFEPLIAQDLEAAVELREGYREWNREAAVARVD